MNFSKHTLFVTRILGVSVLGFALGLQLWDNIPALLGPLYAALAWPFMLFFAGWCVALIALLVRLPQHLKSVGLILAFWLFTSLGAIFTFAQGQDYMQLADIILGSVYLASTYSFLLLFNGMILLMFKSKQDGRSKNNTT